MTSALETIRYHSGMAGEEVADMVDSLELEVFTLREQVEKLTKERDEWKNNHATEVRRARILKERTDMPVERVQAYEQWGKDQEQLAALAEQLTRQREAVQWIQDHCAGEAMPRWEPGMRTTHSRGLILDRTNYVLDLHDLATPALNRIRAEGMRMAAEICEHISDEYREREGRRYPELKTDAETGASDCESSIRACADELEQSNG